MEEYLYNQALQSIRYGGMSANEMREYMALIDKEVEILYANNAPIEYVVKSPSVDIWRHRIICVVACLMMLVGCVVLCSCSEADKVNRNISKQANYFEAERRITVYNARTDNVILEMEGAMSISNNENNELVCTVKTGPNEYKKNYIYLNEYTMYVVEDITGTHTDPYHYKLYFHTDILPDVEVRS